jgi:hypothetical protein
VEPTHKDACDLAAERDEPTRVEVASADTAVARTSVSLDGQPYLGVAAVSLDLSPMLPVADHVTTQEEREASASVAPSADESLRAELWEHRQTLLDAGCRSHLRL